MSDNATIPGLKTIISRAEMTRFVTQLEAISAIPLLLIDNDGTIAYKSAAMEKTDPTGDDYRFPIKINDVQIGEMVACKSNGFEGDKLIELAKSIGQMLTDRLTHEMNVDNLASQLVNSYQELNLFYELSTPLSSVLDVESICSIILNQAVDIVGSERAFMMLVDSVNEQLVVSASVDPTNDLRGLRIKIEDSIYESLIQNGKPLVIEEVEKYPHLRDKINGRAVCTQRL